MVQVQTVRTLTNPHQHRCSHHVLTKTRTRVCDRCNGNHGGNTHKHKATAIQQCIGLGSHILHKNYFAELPAHPCERRNSKNAQDIESVCIRPCATTAYGPWSPQSCECCTQQQAGGTCEGAEIQEICTQHRATKQFHVLIRCLCLRIYGARAKDHCGIHSNRSSQCSEEKPNNWQCFAAESTEQHIHNNRPNDVELLFYRKRPQMSKWGEFRCCRVRRTCPHLKPVRSIQNASDDIATQFSQPVLLEQCTVRNGSNKQREQCGQQSTRTTQPEISQRHSAHSFTFCNKQQRDEIARDNEEHFNAKKTATEPFTICVIDDDRKNS